MAVLLSLRIRSFGNCEFDPDLVWLDLCPDDMSVNENCVCNLGGFVEVAANGFGDRSSTSFDGLASSRVASNPPLEIPYMVQRQTSGLLAARIR